MDAEALETFLAICREGGFTQAARRLHRTQPAISRRIRLLEEELGAPLFERTARGPTLSQAGQTLRPHAERALAALRDAEAAVRALTAAGAGPLPLVCVGTLADARLSAVLKAFAAEHPDADVDLRTATSAEASDLVRRGEAVLGLRYERDPSRDLDCEPIGREPLAVICAPGHPLAGRGVAGLAELRDERWLAFPEVPGRREIAASHVFALFLAHGLGEIAWSAIDSLTAQKRLVEAGFGLALAPAGGIAEELAAGSLATITVEGFSPGQPICAVTRRGGFLSRAARDLLQRLRAVYGQA